MGEGPLSSAVHSAAPRRGWRHRARRWLVRLSLATLIFVAGGLGCAVYEWWRLPPVDALLGTVTPSTVLLDRHGSPLRVELAAHDRLQIHVPLSEIESHLVEATIAAEDERFRSHFGVDPIAVGRAAWSNVSAGRIVSGASTITMQVARLLRPLPRSFYNKFREAVLACYLETRLDKDEILELYLNLSPYGSNIYGVEAAAWRYFGRSADDLSVSQAVLLAGLPQSPSRLRPDRHPKAARKRRDWILDRLQELEKLGAEELATARATPIDASFHPLPLAAPHFTEWALRRAARGETVRASLDRQAQALAEATLRRGLRELPTGDVESGAVVVVDTSSSKIRALVGSEDFFAPGHGQVNGAAARRSPGSLLKPFIFALAFELELATPRTRLRDAPRTFRDGYAPENFDRTFLGEVSAREALIESLNLPAIELLEAVGLERAIERLRRCGIASCERSGRRAGLTLGVGGVEVTLLELVEAYATLARGGLHRPLSFRDDADATPAVRVFERRVAESITSILGDVGFSDLEREGPLALPQVALKTGTSFGLRDAWAVAYTSRFTVGVWVGNFDGRASTSLVGRDAALPVALALARQLTQGEMVGAPQASRSSASEGEQRAAQLSSRVDGTEIRTQGREVQWTSPPDGARIVRHDRPGGEHLRLRAICSREAEADGAATDRPVLSWFVGGRFVGRTRSAEALALPLTAGVHDLLLVGPRGYREQRRVEVR